MELKFATLNNTIREVKIIDANMNANFLNYDKLESKIKTLNNKTNSTNMNWLKSKRQKELSELETSKKNIEYNLSNLMDKLRIIHSKYPNYANADKLVKYYNDKFNSNKININQDIDFPKPLYEQITEKAKEAEKIINGVKTELQTIKNTLKIQTDFKDSVKHSTDMIKNYLLEINSDIKYIDIYIEVNIKKINPKDASDYNSKRENYKNFEASFKIKKGVAKYGQYFPRIEQVKEALKEIEKKIEELKKVCNSSSSSEEDMMSSAENLLAYSKKAQNIISKIDKSNLNANTQMVKEATSTLRDCQEKLLVQKKALSEQVQIIKNSKKEKKSLDEIITIIGKVLFILSIIAGIII